MSLFTDFYKTKREILTASSLGILAGVSLSAAGFSHFTPELPTFMTNGFLLVNALTQMVFLRQLIHAQNLKQTFKAAALSTVMSAAAMAFVLVKGSTTALPALNP